MSITTEITRLQGIKTDIRTALVTQGIAQAISHNMADFSADILAIQGGSEGVYITVTCDSAYQGYDIILSANGTEIDRKQCPSSSIVNFFVSADNVTLPATFTISNSLNSITQIEKATIYGWYETNLRLEPIALVPYMTSNTQPYGECIGTTGTPGKDKWTAFSSDSTCYEIYGQANNLILGYKSVNPIKVTKLQIKNNVLQESGRYALLTFDFKGSNDGNNWDTLASNLSIPKNNTSENIYDINNDNYYLYHAIFGKTGGSSNYVQVGKVQFYGY